MPPPISIISDDGPSTPQECHKIGEQAGQIVGKDGVLRPFTPNGTAGGWETKPGQLRQSIAAWRQAVEAAYRLQRGNLKGVVGMATNSGPEAAQDVVKKVMCVHLHLLVSRVRTIECPMKLP